MPTPIIGITTFRQLNKYGLPMICLMESYVQAIVQAGGAPFLIPLGLPEELLKEMINKVDGLLFTGGGDIDPNLYGGEAHPKVDQVDEDRDRMEMQAIKDSMRARKPFLGICRGLQLVNVAAGGALYTHITDQYPDALEHCYYPDWPRAHIAHEVNIKANSRLAQALGTKEVRVNSQHHQGISKLAPGLEANAFAPDGLIEGIEIPNYPFGLAVQWHPEWLRDQQPMRALFAAFIQAARLKHEAQNALDLSA
jgi:putative glutamine amidotransferase